MNPPRTHSDSSTDGSVRDGPPRHVACPWVEGDVAVVQPVLPTLKVFLHGRRSELQGLQTVVAHLVIELHHPSVLLHVTSLSYRMKT